MANDMVSAKARALDFTNVTESSGINPKRKPAGDYLATITKVTEKPSSKGNPMWTFVLTLEEDRSAAYPHYCVLDTNSLWKLRELFAAAGIAIPKKKVNVDPNKIIGKKVGISLEDDEYEGKEKSIISGICPAADVTEAKPAPKASAPAKTAPAAEEAEDVDDVEDLDELDVEDL